MDTLAFIPRAVKKHEPVGSTKKPPAPPTAQASVSPIPEASSDGQAHLQVETRPNMGNVSRPLITGPDQYLPELVKPPASQLQQQVNLWELAALVCLALSDYALWSDPDLKRKIDLGLEGRNHVAQVGGDEEMPTADTEEDAGGYIQLTYILQHAYVFRLSQSRYGSYPPTLYVKALRKHASDIVDVRLVLSSGSGSSRWSARTASQLSGSGYEVRRRPGPALQSECQPYGKLVWEGRTIYMENIPPTYRTITGIIHLISNLLPNSSTDKMFKRLQNITFLPHHKDKTGDVPVCKGFVLVTLAHADDVEFLLEEWPWNRPAGVLLKKSDITDKQRSDPTIPSDEEASGKLRNEARRFGLRMLGKSNWEVLKAEYLLYRQRLVEEINQFQDDAQNAPLLHAANIMKESTRTSTFEHCTKLPSASSSLDINDPYPYGCLVCIRNVHSETNKTTLRSLFNSLCTIPNATAHSDDGAGIDYVDYNKGMENCFLRLRTPVHASYLVQQINSQHLYQQSGLDAEGIRDPSAMNPGTNLQAELILGTREALYWNKVPERVKRQSVGRAFTLSCTHPAGVTDKYSPRKSDINVVISAEAPYPTDCLVFVRNVHIGSNKTTLRTLFTHLGSQAQDSTIMVDQGDVIDYVDYSKGTDSCHIRFCKPAHAAHLVANINSAGIMQMSGLDATGVTGSPSIIAELVTGKREELYWEKLPERVRKQAVEKVISFRNKNEVREELQQTSSQLKRKREKRA